MTGWPVEIDGQEYCAIPESWIEHGDDLEVGSPRLYAVSGYIEDHSKRLHVRYAHPVEETALQTTTTAVELGDGLVAHWPRRTRVTVASLARAGPSRRTEWRP